MCNVDNVLKISDIYDFLKTQNITADVIELYQNNNRVVDYLIDKKYMLRISKSVLDEHIKQDRVKTVSYVPKIYSSGSFTALGCHYNFLIKDYGQVDDLSIKWY